MSMTSKAVKKDGILETVKTIVYALLIAGVFRTLFFQPFWIPSGSMKDTLLIGDFLFVNKMAYGYSQYSCPFSMCPISGRILGNAPELGDVVVFRHPVTGSDFIKRVVGLPGDKVQVKDGVLFINGIEAVQTPQPPFEEVFEKQGPVGIAAAMRQLGRGAGRHLRQGTVHRDAAQWCRAFDPEHPHRATGQHAGIHRARRAFLLHGRQPRQFHRQPRGAIGAGRRFCAVRKPDRARRPHHVLVRGPVDAVLLDLAVRPLLQGDRVKLSAELKAFADRLGHDFSRPDLLHRALTHSSMSSATRPDNQRLEFLGDRVLGLVMAEALLRSDTDASEGKLAPRFNALVRKETCADVARDLGLGDVLRLGRSEMLSGGRRKEALLGDAMEAVIAAVYLDAGFEAAQRVILAAWGDRVSEVDDDARDPKTSLQEWAQARGLPPPDLRTGRPRRPDHAPQFTIEARLETGEKAAAKAASKRAAEQGAARALLKRLDA